MKSTAILGVAILLGLGSSPVLAQGNYETGRQLAYTCAGCHGITGYKNAYPFYNVPKIAGQNYTYLLNALKAYQSGERTHPTMQAQAESYSDQDLTDIATFLSQVTKQGGK